MIALRKGDVEAFTRMIWQVVLNLRGHSRMEASTTLSGSAMSETDVMTKDGIWATPLAQPTLGLLKLRLCAVFGDYEQGAMIAIQEGDTFLKLAPGANLGLSHPFLRGVCLYAAASTSFAKRSTYKKHAKKMRAKVQSWASKGNRNAVQQLKLLDAEHEACCGKAGNVKRLYEIACAEAHQFGPIQDAALANERYAQYLLLSSSQDSQNEARGRLELAVRFYQEWGAVAKVESLLARYADLQICVGDLSE